MNYRIELAEDAKVEIREAARWLRHHASRAVADRWLDRLNRAIRTLETRPMRCPIAAENDRFPEEIRELLHGRGPGKYRIIFTIRDATISILHVRHTSRDELRP